MPDGMRPMALQIQWTRDERLMGADVVQLLRERLAAGEDPTVFVPGYDQQLQAQRQLAHAGGLSLGVTTTTPLAWAKERWGVWGDGSQLVDGMSRRLLVRVAMAAFNDMPGDEKLAENPGTVHLLGQLATQALPWLPLAPDGSLDLVHASCLSLTDGERTAISVVGRYACELRIRHLIEKSELFYQLVDSLLEAGVSLGPMVVVGYSSMGRALRHLLAELSRHTQVTIVFLAGNAEYQAACRDLAGQLGAEVGEPSLPKGELPYQREGELQDLLDGLFCGREHFLDAGGAVSLLEAEGVHAEAELVARRVTRLVDDGASSVAVVAPDLARAWRELAPKLSARGISCQGELRVALRDSKESQAFFDYAHAVARLAELDQTWPELEQTPEGKYVRLGSMDWWPPRELTEFLLSDLSFVPTEQAWRLDLNWRKNRLLTPADVLQSLQNPKRTSVPVAQATTELLKGRLGSAASKLLAPLAGRIEPGLDDYVRGLDGKEVWQTERAQDQLADTSCVGILSQLIKVASTLKQLGFTADPAVDGHVSLTILVDLAEDALTDTSIETHPTIGVDEDGSSATVRIMSAKTAGIAEPAAFDALVLVGQSSEESPIGTGDDALSSLLVTLGVESQRDLVREQRVLFLQMIAAARHNLVVEHSLHDRALKERWPSVMLAELVSCYRTGEDSESGRGTGGLSVQSLDEYEADANASPTGLPSTLCGSEKVGDDGVVSPALRGIVVVPPEGRVELRDGRPLLSASQLESYLECPYKWFSLRRLSLRDNDAGFTGAEMGTFVHKVLELTHTQMLDQALVAAGVERDPETRGAAFAQPLPGSRVSSSDPEGIAAAQKVLQGQFDQVLREQYRLQGRGARSQALVPHSGEDQGYIEELRRDLLSEIEYEAGLFTGFEPRLFEWSFGRGEESVEYAGAYLLGTVDRVDVDAHGQAVVIDYKHRGTASILSEYGVTDPDGEGDDFVLPRRVQSLVYGQVVRRRYPDLRVVAAVYLGTKGDHCVMGAVSDNLEERVFGEHPLSKRQRERALVDDRGTFGMDKLPAKDQLDTGIEGAEGTNGGTGSAGPAHGMDALLDATEAAVAEKVDELIHGNIEANPRDDAACTYCPVLNCSKRRS